MRQSMRCITVDKCRLARYTSKRLNKLSLASKFCSSEQQLMQSTWMPIMMMADLVSVNGSVADFQLFIQLYSTLVLNRTYSTNFS